MLTHKSGTPATKATHAPRLKIKINWPPGLAPVDAPKPNAATPTTAAAPPIQIDPEFQARIVPLSPEERQQLEANLLRDGCRDPLVVWQQANTLLDGHHRFEICQRRKIMYTTRWLNFKTREAALEWIDTNQLGRRNLTPEQISLVRGRIYNLIKRQGARADRRSGNRSVESGARPVDETTRTNADRTSDHSEQKSDAATALAKKHKVSRATIVRDGRHARAVESLKPIVPDIEQRVMNGTVPSQAAVLKAARTPARAAEILTTTKRTPHVRHNSRDTNEWYTPAEYVDAARRVLERIDLDPASCEEANAIVKADRIFTVKDNGLRRAWSGRVWMNPPYGTDLIEPFAKKLVYHVRRGHITQAIVLLNNATETGWFQSLVEAASHICFPKGRIKFRMPGGKAPGAPTQGQALLYFYNHDWWLEKARQRGPIKAGESSHPSHAFVTEFSRFGFVVGNATNNAKYDTYEGGAR